MGDREPKNVERGNSGTHQGTINHAVVRAGGSGKLVTAVCGGEWD